MKANSTIVVHVSSQNECLSCASQLSCPGHVSLLKKCLQSVMLDHLYTGDSRPSMQNTSPVRKADNSNVKLSLDYQMKPSMRSLALHQYYQPVREVLALPIKGERPCKMQLLVTSEVHLIASR